MAFCEITYGLYNPKDTSSPKFIIIENSDLLL
jgi:hypothetical protein